MALALKEWKGVELHWVWILKTSLLYVFVCWALSRNVGNPFKEIEYNFLYLSYAVYMSVFINNTYFMNTLKE